MAIIGPDREASCCRCVTKVHAIFSQLAHFMLAFLATLFMKSKLNCTRHLDERHDQRWEATHALIQEEHQLLQEDYPAVSQVDLHVRAFSRKTEAHLLMQDGEENLIEARADSEDLEVAVSLVFQRAKHQLGKIFSY